MKVITLLFLLFISSSYAQDKSLEKLVAENRGKVILIDFWASWCRPCREELPKSIKLHEKLKEKSVVFMYISIDKNKSDWEKASEKEGIYLEKYNLWNVKRDGRFAEFKINMIPRYMLIDKTGNIVNADVDRPGRSELRKEINKYLAE
jgi:thiol-disulfide isomerase/thioredoxin